ncbi:MAG: hypothetical protein JWM64_1260 [Frankiales bacterium]|nr:hypothetical protein [Frankiales bacterium]
MSLRDLDARLVPRAAQRLRALLDRSRPARPGRPAGPLRRLDDRFTARGPLRLVRDVPQVGLLVVAAVFFSGSAVALSRSGDDDPSAVSSSSRVLGPELGAPVADYVAAVRARAVEESRDHPRREHVALVSLSGYRTPEQAQALLGGLEVERAYLRVPGDAATEVLPADVQDLVGDLRLLYAATATRKADDQEEFLGLARSITPSDPEQRRFKEFYETSARLAGQEATAYRTGCACLFSVVVTGRADALAALPALDGVRAVELADSGLRLAQLRVRPLAPEQTATVSAEVPVLPSPPSAPR